MDIKEIETVIYPIVKRAYDIGSWSKNPETFPIIGTSFNVVVSSDGYYFHVEVVETITNEQFTIYDGRKDIMSEWVERVGNYAKWKTENSTDATREPRGFRGCHAGSNLRTCSWYCGGGS